MSLLYPLQCLAARLGETCAGQGLAGSGQGLCLDPMSFHWFDFSPSSWRCPSCVVLGRVTRGHRTLLLPCRAFLQLLSSHCSPVGCSCRHILYIPLGFSAPAQFPIKSTLFFYGIFFNALVPKLLTLSLCQCQPTSSSLCCPQVRFAVPILLHLP